MYKLRFVTEQPLPQTPSLTDRALNRLRKLAAGNGLEPSALVVFDAQEKILTLHGKIFISPLCKTENLSYMGPARGKERKTVPSFAALQGAVAKHEKDFAESADWVEAVVQELTTLESQGWGLENAKVTLPERSAIYAATQVCPSCNGRQTLTCQQCLGRGTLTCHQCQGRGREPCYYCFGSGQDPQHPGQLCRTCDGTRFAPCRLCQGRGYVSCPTCKGNRGTPCPNCNATGKMTQEVKVTCGAETSFSVAFDELPSGFRRGLDRIGIARLGKGHADITAIQPKGNENDKPSERIKNPVMLYDAVLPYAEMKMSFNGKKSVVSAVGKRCVITGVPNFLDASLKPWREKLQLAASGSGSLDEALRPRAMKDILSLVIAGKDSEREARRIYPYGLSSEALASMLSDMRLAVKRTTLTARTAVAVVCFALCSALFAFLFKGGFEARLTLSWNPYAGLGFDLGVLAVMLGLSWITLNFSARYALQRRFPQNALALQQKIGKTGYVMLGAIVIAFALAHYLAPVKPLWLLELMQR